MVSIQFCTHKRCWKKAEFLVIVPRRKGRLGKKRKFYYSCRGHVDLWEYQRQADPNIIVEPFEY